MSSRPVKIPGPDHPITIAANPNCIEVRLQGHLIARTSRALTMREGGYPPVHYIPRTDTEMPLLRDSTHTTYCPFKGEAGYFSIVLENGGAENAVWFYAEPFAAVSEVRDHLAFYADKVEITEVAGQAE